MSREMIRIKKDELKELIKNAVEEKLIELLGDPDEGLRIKESFRKRLLKQKKKVLSGERGKLLNDVVKELGLE